MDYQTILDWQIEEQVHTYTERDTMLYALGVGYGADPLDLKQLSFVYEKNLQAAPTQAVVLGYPGFWMGDPATGINAVKLVHGEQGLQIHQPLPTAGTVIGQTRVTGINDKGPEKGALVYSERKVFNHDNGDLLATLTSTTFCRGDGGCGGDDPAPYTPHKLPERSADFECDLPLTEQAALIYRLSGDYNPLHADLEVADKAGFKRPILHGLATMGVAGHALLKMCCEYDASRLTAMRLRFSAPVYPGEVIRTQIWQQAEQLSFRCSVPARDQVVLSNGAAVITK